MENQIDMRPERDMRQEFIDQSIDDFTYKKDFTPEQLAMWQWVKEQFSNFKQIAEQSLRNVPTDRTTRPLTQTDEYFNFKATLRNAERWFNTAIANDWHTGQPVPMNETLVAITYDGPSGGNEIRHSVCDYISDICFTLMLAMAQRLPLGRALSVARTQMQEVRGLLLDTVNENWLED